jgi:hypothetical protein
MSATTTTTCEVCSKPMTLHYEVVERDTRFALWECNCGHKALERKPAPKAGVPAAATAAAPPPTDEDD